MTDKTIAEEDVECPFCHNLVHVKLVKEVITEPVKGEYEKKFIINKGVQTTLKKV